MYQYKYEDKEKVNQLFLNLRKSGYIARQNFTCCGSCASYELGEYCETKGIPEGQRKVVYYHRQDTDRFQDRGRLMLGWSGNGTEIVRMAKDLGITTAWDGSEDTRIELVFAL